jgi:tripartite-type tricarboxylate transporter receptor subunit TctC
MRVIALKLSEILGQQVVVENRPGAGNTIATSIVAKSPPDGYTLLMCPLSDAITPALYKSLPYVLLRDFAGVSLLGTTANLLTVHPSLPARSIEEFIALAKANPGKIDYSTTGIGTSPHLSMELLRFRTGIDVLHIPYKGRTMPDLLAGRVAVNFGNIAVYIEPVKAGKLRALGVSTPKRSQRLPEVPTIAESGVPDFDVTVWYGICAPAAVAKDVIDKINGGVVKALGMPDLQQRLIQLGVDPESSTSEHFGRLLRSESAKWAKVVKDAGIQPL